MSKSGFQPPGFVADCILHGSASGYAFRGGAKTGADKIIKICFSLPGSAGECILHGSAMMMEAEPPNSHSAAEPRNEGKGNQNSPE